MIDTIKIRCHFDYEDTEASRDDIIDFLVDKTDYDRHEIEGKSNEELLALLSENEPDEFSMDYLEPSPTCIRIEVTPNE